MRLILSKCSGTQLLYYQKRLYNNAQKVAAMVDKVAADLGFRASKLRWLLPEKYFDFAASSAAGLLLDDNINNLRPNQPPRALKEPSLYIIVALNTQRFGFFVYTF